MANHYLVLMKPRLGVLSTQVENKLRAVANNFMRVETSPYTWIICAPRQTAALLSQSLMPFAEPDGQLLVMAVTPTDAAGWMPQDFWTWTASHRRGP
jgi:hypothetical protein